MQARFKEQDGMVRRGKDKLKTSRDKKTRTPQGTKVAGPANRRKPSPEKEASQGRNQKEWASEKRMAAWY